MTRASPRSTTSWRSELDRPLIADNREERADHVLQVALRNVDCHGWDASITEDSARLHLAGGSVSIDLGLGDTVARYIEWGLTG